VSRWTASAWNAASLLNGGRRSPDCQSAAWDGWTPATSADLNGTGLVTRPAAVLRSERFYASEGGDISNIFCALSDRCLVVNSTAPVDITITAPDGRRVSRTLAEIPGASFASPADGDRAVLVLTVPFAASGDYQIRVVAKNGSTIEKGATLEATLGESKSVFALKPVLPTSFMTFRVTVP
jgi:hypothetical protein